MDVIPFLGAVWKDWQKLYAWEHEGELTGPRTYIYDIRPLGRVPELFREATESVNYQFKNMKSKQIRPIPIQDFEHKGLGTHKRKEIYRGTTHQQQKWSNNYNRRTIEPFSYQQTSRLTEEGKIRPNLRPRTYADAVRYGRSSDLKTQKLHAIQQEQNYLRNKLLFLEKERQRLQ